DSDGVPTSGVTYQWLRDGVAIGGETNSSYTLTQDDAGHKITVRATYKDNAGHDETPLSAPLDVENIPPQPQPNHAGTITISGEAKVGATLTAAVTDADGTAQADITYNWYADGVKIGEGAHYTLTAAEKGKTITVRAAYTDDKGTAENPTSDATAAVTDDTPPPAYAPGVTLHGPGEITEGGKAVYTVDLDLAPLPKADTAAGLLDTLRHNAGHGILFGQHQGLNAGRADADAQGYKSDVHALTGHYPSIVGLAMMEQPMDRSKSVEENGKAMGAEIAKVDALGGIAAVSAHWDNPMPGPNGANDFSNVSLKRLLPGGDLNGTLNGWLDTVVAMAQHAVRADGSKIPFIFRPLHEGNGEWAWWYYGREGAETYKELFRYVVNYVKEHGADGQILTAFAPNGNFGGDESRYLQLYPGDDVVDILGYDGYDTNAAKPAKDGWVKEVVEDMAMLARMAEARGKVAALTEFGRGGDKMIKPQGNVDPEFYTDLLKGILADPDARKIAYMMTWANWGENDIYVPKEGEELAANFKAFVEQLLLTRVADRDITVDVTIEHGTTDDGDVRLSTQRVTIRKGESSATFTVEAVADGKAEGDEKYTVKISNPQGATIEAGKDSVATTVHDDGSVSPPTPLNHEGQITISGEAKVGSTLTATVSDADDFAADKVQYQWLRDGVAIDKATGSTYQLTNDDAGHKITVRATYKDNAGHDETPTSDATDIPAPPANHEGTVTISGEAKVGSTLTATVTDADEFAADKVQYQWLRDGVAISGQTGNTYQLTRDDAGHKITVRAVYKDNAGHDETPLSLPTDTVADNGATVNHEGTIRVEGTNRVGYTFTAVIDDADGVPKDGVTYEWYEFYGKHLGSGKTITLTEEQVGMQLQVKASYTDNAGHHEDITSRFSGTVLPDHGGGTGAGINPPAADAPHVTLSGADTVKEGDTIIYTVSLDKPVDKDVSVDIKIRHGSTTVDDVGVRWGMQRATIKAGETSTRIWVDTAKDGEAEGNETYTLTISDAVYGTVYAPNVKPIEDKVSAQSVFMLSYKYPLAQPNTDIYSDYWQAVHKAGSKKIPYVLVTPDAKPDAILDPGYVKVIAKNIELGFKNVVYVRTIQQTRDLAEVKAEIEKYFELYGKDNIHGIYLDEINPHSNAAVAYLAELYNYIKSQYGNKLVVANPGIHITDAIAPYADLFMLNESTADDYINHYENPTSAFENDPANAHRIMHTIYDASAADYDRIIELTRSRNAGWVYLTTDSTHPDGRPYNDLPQDFGQLVDHINDLGATPADPNRSGTLPVLNGAYIDNAGVETTIIDADSSNRPGSVHIEGEAKVGSELTATVADSDDFAADKVQYQWLRDGVAIKDANGKTYQLTADDAGHKITVQATYKDNAGHDENPTSDATDIPAPPANHAGTVAITGEAKVGGTLTATVSDADNFDAASVSYQWLRDGVAISGETSSSYTLTRDDAGHKITVRAVYKDNAGHDENPTSDAADIPAPPANHAGTVTISGEALVGKTLTATIADGDGVDPAQAQYQWLVDGKAVNGATGATYEVRPEDAGKAISVHVEYTDNAAHGEKLDSGRADATVDHHSGYKLVWQDEFNGNALDENNWGYQTGGWNSSGVQNYYSAGDKNVSVSDGSLKITAHHESAPIVRGSGEDQKSYDFSSGFVQTQGKQAWTYGYFEARLKMPNAENGSLWPAFWMSPNEAKYGGWPRSGEIDILETRSYINNADRDHDGQIKVAADAHWGTGSGKGKHSHKQGITYVDGSDEWHTYAVKWQEGKLEYYVDGRHYHTIDNFGAPNATEHPGPFNIPFYLRLNVAVGGDYMSGKYQDAHNSIDKFPATMEVDYVRVYQLDGNTPPTPQPNHAGQITISGEAKVGGTLTATVSDADNFDAASVSYQWLRDGVAISGETSSSYTLTRDDAGHKITVRAVYKDNAGHDENPTSDAADIPAPPAENHAPSGAVTVSGVVEVGRTLVAGNNLDDQEGMGQVSYQWLRDGQDISGATGDKYTLTDADAGHRISVRASYTDGAQNAESKASFTTGSTAAAGTAPTYHDISGQAEIEWAGVKWYVRDSDWNSGSPGSGNWSRGNTQIDGTDMHMSLTNPDGKTPIASEIISSNAMGYGTYETTFRADFSKFDPYTVFGFFTYEWSQTTVAGNREIDGIEVSRWGDPALKGVFTYYPPSEADNGIKMRPGYTWAEDVKHVSMKLDWQPDKITWTLRNAETGDVLHQVESTRDIPDAANQQVHFNLWTYKPTDPPNEWWTATPQKVTLGSFNYTPLSGGTPPAANKEGSISITGEAKVGGVLSANVTDGDGVQESAITYQWLRDGVAIDQATGSTYRLTADDAGHKITVQATYKDNAHHDESPSATQDIARTPSGENHSGSITIKGEAKVGSTMTAEISDRDGVPTSGVKYRWFGDDKPIDGANGATFAVTDAVVGQQIRVEAIYTDNAGHDERPTSDLTPAVTTGAMDNHSALFPPAAADAPRVSLSGAATVNEGRQATYTVSLDKAADKDVAVDVQINYGTASDSDAKLTWDIKRVIIPKGQTGKDFTVDTTGDGQAEGNETYTVKIANALMDDFGPQNVPPFSGSVTAQSQMIPAYKYPTGNWETDTYWDTVHKIGGEKIPYTVINPSSGAGKTVDPNYATLVDQNIAAGIKNIGYIRTIYSNRPIEEVKAEVDRYFEFYGKDKIHGFFFDELANTNEATAYMAELYNYVKGKGAEKVVVANPGWHITDAMSPYADIFVTTEISADQYINNYQKPTSAFENNPENAKHIYHMIHDVSPEQYDQVLQLSRERNAGWVFITSDSQENPLPPEQREAHPEQDGNPYNYLPENMASLSDRIANLGAIDSPLQHAGGKIVSAQMGNDSVTTEIIDADSGNMRAPQEAEIRHDDASAAQSAHHDGQDDAAQPHDDSAGHSPLFGEELPHADLGGLLNLEGEAVLDYLGAHSGELLARAQAHDGLYGIEGSGAADTFITAHGNHLLQGGAGADTFAFLLDGNSSGDRILDFDIAAGDRIVFAGEHMQGAHISVAHEHGGTQVNITDSAGNRHSVDITTADGNAPDGQDLLSHVEIRGPQGYHDTAYHGDVNRHLPEEEQHSGIVI
ncbi:spherulation-specific family 4 protein, partial [uncultured Cardiobacterium sp.]|uniref:spherulation-specific family 4 protein n=1 Tax=uncultured Cardiobacterium sp. TaxID=417619 RepID=UPI002623502E